MYRIKTFILTPPLQLITNTNNFDFVSFSILQFQCWMILQNKIIVRDIHFVINLFMISLRRDKLRKLSCVNIMIPMISG